MSLPNILLKVSLCRLNSFLHLPYRACHAQVVGYRFGKYQGPGVFERLSPKVVDTFFYNHLISIWLMALNRKEWNIIHPQA